MCSSVWKGSGKPNVKRTYLGLNWNNLDFCYWKKKFRMTGNQAQRRHCPCVQYLKGKTPSNTCLPLEDGDLGLGNVHSSRDRVDSLSFSGHSSCFPGPCDIKISWVCFGSHLLKNKWRREWQLQHRCQIWGREAGRQTVRGEACERTRGWREGWEQLCLPTRHVPDSSGQVIPQSGVAEEQRVPLDNL